MKRELIKIQNQLFYGVGPTRTKTMSDEEKMKRAFATGFRAGFGNHHSCDDGISAANMVHFNNGITLGGFHRTRTLSLGIVIPESRIKTNTGVKANRKFDTMAKLLVDAEFSSYIQRITN